MNCKVIDLHWTKVASRLRHLVAGAKRDNVIAPVEVFIVYT